MAPPTEGVYLDGEQTIVRAGVGGGSRGNTAIGSNQPADPVQEEALEGDQMETGDEEPHTYVSDMEEPAQQQQQEDEPHQIYEEIPEGVVVLPGDGLPCKNEGIENMETDEPHAPTYVVSDEEGDQILLAAIKQHKMMKLRGSAAMLPKWPKRARVRPGTGHTLPPNTHTILKSSPANSHFGLCILGARSAPTVLTFSTTRTDLLMAFVVN